MSSLLIWPVVLPLGGALVALATGIYACGYFGDKAQQTRFWPLWLLLLTALNALFLSRDLCSFAMMPCLGSG